MTEVTLGLVLLSAVAHAAWNFIAKHASAGPAFNWLFDSLAVVICLPLAIGQMVLQPPHLGIVEWIFIVGSATLELAYFLVLGKAYRVGDLSLVYPLARGSGPLLATIAAVALLGERPTPLAVCGTLLITVGVIVLAGDPRRLHASTARASVTFALLTGALIAAYTLWDKEAVSGIGIPPILYFYLFTVVRTLMLTVYAAGHRSAVAAEWRAHKRHAIGIAVLSPASYILVLFALSTSPVSYVAPAREIGILLGALMGARWLAEGQASRRLAGAAAMVAGVVALAIG